MHPIYPVVEHLHSALRWLLLVLLIVSIVISLYKYLINKGLSSSQKLLAQLTVYAAHLQLVAGILLYLVSPKVIFSSDSLKSPMLRFFLVEHVSAMLIAIALITIGFSRFRKSGSSSRAVRQLFWYYLLALVIILAMIPWPFMHYGGQWI